MRRALGRAGAAVVVGATAGTAVLCEPGRRTEKVERVVVMCRHGDRTPAHWTQHAIGSKTITADELAFWSATNRNLIPSKAVAAEWQQYCPNAGGDMVPALGTLTWLGAATHQANGLWLRDRYVAEHGLLPSTLAAGDVVARSTPFPRCVQSCQNLLLGLYPPEHRGGPGDDNHTTPVGSTSRQHEPMYGVWYTNADDCPRMLQLLHHMYATQSAAINADDAALEARVKAEIGVCINGNAGLGDAIRCQQQYRLPLFNGWSDEFATTVREYTHRTFMLKYESPEFNNTMMAALLPEILAALDPDNEAPKMTVLLGHDSVPMMPALVFFGAWDGKWPDYASMLTLEVVSIDGERFVRCFYNNRPTVMKGFSRAEDGLCPFDTFVSLAKARIPPGGAAAACRAVVAGGGKIPDHSIEACKEVLLHDGDGWGKGRTPGEQTVL